MKANMRAATVILLLLPIIHSELCYELLETEMKHYAYRKYTNAESIQDCMDQCADYSNCNSFSYRPWTIFEVKNCLLSDTEYTRGPDTNQNLVQDKNWDVYRLRQCEGVWNQGNEIEEEYYRCFRIFSKLDRLKRTAVYRRIENIQLDDCKRECYRDTKCYGFSFSLAPTENCFLSDKPRIVEYLERDEDSDVFENLCYDETGAGFRDTDEYTVDGQRCIEGGCRLNQDVGYYYCNIEGGDGWNYCCKPGARCEADYGEDPWCYVGQAGEDQWRPCKDHYHY